MPPLVATGAPGATPELEAATKAPPDERLPDVISTLRSPSVITTALLVIPPTIQPSMTSPSATFTLALVWLLRRIAEGGLFGMDIDPASR